MSKKLILLCLVLVMALGMFALPVAAAEVWDGSTSEYLTPVDPTQDYDATTNPLAIRNGADLNYMITRGNTFAINDRKLQIKVGDEIKESTQNAANMAYKQTADIILNDETFTFDPNSGIIIVSDGTNTGYLGTGHAGFVYNVDTPSEYNKWYTAASLTGTLEQTTNYSGKFNLMSSIAWGSGNGVNNVDFRGTYDGDNHEIRGYYNNSALIRYDNCGLFGQVARGGVVKNVNFVGACSLVGTTSTRFGLFACYVVNGTITNCFADGIVVGINNNTAYGGGFIGNLSSGTISQCAFHGTVMTSSQGYTGHFIGGCTGGTVQNCYSIGLKLGSTSGVFAGNQRGTFTNCYTVTDCYPYLATARPFSSSSTITNSYFNTVLTYNNDGNAVRKDLSELKASLLGDAYEDDTTGVNYGLPMLKDMAGKAVSAKDLRVLPSRTAYTTSGRGVPDREFTVTFDPSQYFAYVGSGDLNVTCGDVAAIGEGSAAGAAVVDNGDGTYTFKVTPTTRDDVKYSVPVSASAGGETAESRVIVGIKLNHVPNLKQAELADITTTTGHAKAFFLSNVFGDEDSDSLTYEVATTEDGGETWSDFTTCSGYYNYPAQTEPKTELLKFRAYDGYEYSDTVIQKIIVTQNRAPVFAEGVSATEKAKVSTGVQYSKPLGDLFVDPDGDNISYKYTIDDGAEQSAASYNPTLTYKNFEPGVHTIKVIANDGADASAPLTITLTVTKYGYNSDVWTGAVDVTWYDPYVEEFTLTKPAQLAGLAAIVAGQVPSIPADDFEDRTITLGNDIVLNNATFTFDEESAMIKTVAGDQVMYLGTNIAGMANGASFTSNFAVPYDAPGGSSLKTVFSDTLVDYGDTTLTLWNTPIGTASTQFKGTFDGNGHKISGLYYSLNNTNNIPGYRGLFGYNAGTVKDLSVDGLVYACAYAAGIVANNTGTVENCVNDVHILQTTQGNGSYIGGVVGNSGVGGNLTDLQNNGFIYSRGPVGGVVGAITSGKASRLINYGNVNLSWAYNGNTWFAGGVIGQVSGVNTVASECVNRGSINKYGINNANARIAGIVGTVNGAELKDSYNTASFNCAGYAGGIISMITGTGANVHNCYNVGDVLLSNNNGIKAAYGSAIGQISNIASQTITDIYYLDTTYTTTPTVTSEDVMARTAEEMRSEDFLTEIGEAFAADTENVNDGYPILADALLSGSKDILDFTIGEASGDISGRTIIFEDFEVEAEDDTLTYAPVFSVSPAAAAVPASGEEVTFTQTKDDPSVYIATYMVTAENGSKAKYVVALKTKASVASVTVDPAEVSVVAGFEGATVSAAVQPVNANEQGITWSSGDESIATVDENGFVQGVAVGETTIIATSVDGGKTAACAVTVTAFVDVTGVTLPETASVIKTEQITLTPAISPENASNKAVTWASDDETIATVDENGVVTGVKEGEVDIIVTTVDGEKTAACKVTVESVRVESIDVTQVSKLGIGDSKPLTATIIPETATVQDVIWSSDNPAVAAVDENGVVTGKSAGEAVITATAVDNEEISASATITVSAEPYDVQWAGAFSAAGNSGNYGVELPSDPAKTREVWAANVGNGSPVILGDYVYTYAAAVGMNGFVIGGETSTFYKINKETGEIVATTKNCPGVGGYYYSYATYGGGLIYATGGSYVMCFDPDSMDMLWASRAGLGSYSCIQYVAGSVICNGYVFDGVTGEQIADLPGDYNWSNGAKVGKYFYVADYAGNIRAFDTTDWSDYGSVQFKFGGTVLQPGVAYLADLNRLYWGDAMSTGIYSIAIDPATGKLLENTLIQETTNFTTTCAPVVYGDRVYLAGQGGDGGAVHVFDAKTLKKIYVAKGANEKIQSTPILYHDDETDTTYVYAQDYARSDLVVLKDAPGSTSGKLEKVITPSHPNYAFEQMACDKDGAIYMTADSGWLHKFERSKADRPQFETDLSTERVNIKLNTTAEALAVNATVTDGGTITYQWQQSADEVEWSDIENATAASYTPATDVVGLTYYRVKATNTTEDGSVEAISQVTPFNVFDGADQITVSFRLIGCTKSEEDVDFMEEPGDYKGAEYQNWMKTKEYTISNGSTAKELIQIAFEDKGIKAVGVENNYIRAITAPEVLGGETMEEFTNGLNSGWMYTVNGKHPDAINLTTLNDGDVVLMHYVNDYKYEDESTNPSSPYLNKWLEVPDVEPEEQLPDYQAAKAVEDMIAAIGEVSLDDEEAIAAAREAYEALSEEQKKLVKNEDVLKAAEERLAELQEKAKEDAAAAAPVDEAIAALPDVDKVSLDDEEAILAAKEAYDGLTDDQKAYVANADKLDAVLEKLEELKNKPTENPFVDVTEKDYFYDAVLWAVAKDITKGTDDTHFSPAKNCSRGQVATFLWRAAGMPEAEGENPFSDVTEKDYFYDAVLWAVENEITTGTGNGKFSPNGDCSRGQVATFLWRAAGSPEPTSAVNPFGDVKADDYFYKAVLWAVEKEITKGTDATHFSPAQVCTRGQVVTFLYRAQ